MIKPFALKGKSKGAAQHLTAHFQADYYGQEIGEWGGKLAEELGLKGKVEAGDKRFVQMLQGKHAGKPLTIRGEQTERTAYDINLTCPKSVSIMAEFDPRIKQAFREASREAFGELEKWAARRVRDGGNHETKNSRVTGNLAAALFFHDTNRDIDPHLHCHCVVANATRGEGGRVYALETSEIFAQMTYLGRVQESLLARKVAALGYRVETIQEKGKVKTWRIGGVSAEMETRFSRGSKRVEQEAQKELARRKALLAVHAREAPGMSVYDWLKARGDCPWSDLSAQTLSVRERDVVERNTRPRKLELTVEERKERVLERMPPEVQYRLHELVGHASRIGPKFCQQSDGMAFERTRDRLMERKSEVSAAEFIAEALRHDPLADYRQLGREVESGMVRLHGEGLGARITTQATMEREAASVQMAEARMGPALAPDADFASWRGVMGQKLGEDQKRALEMVARTDRMAAVIQGDAGTGKTTSMMALRDVLAARGLDVEFLSPQLSGVAALKSDGLPARTVASFLQTKEPTSAKLLVVDEAGLIGSIDGYRLLGAARASGARVLFVGDTKQNLPVAEGDFLRLLEVHSKIDRARLSEIRRQRDPEVRAWVGMVADGKVKEALTALRDGELGERGTIVERGDYLEEAARRYVNAIEKGGSAFCIARTWDELDQISSSVREGLRERGKLGEGVERMALRSYGWTKAELVDLSRYEAGMGVSVKGETWEVEEVTKQGLVLSNGQTVDPRRSPVLIAGKLRQLDVAPGDELLIRESHRGAELVNNEVVRVKEVLGDGSIKTADGRLIPREFASLEYAYARTAQSIQGPAADRAILAVGQGWSDNNFYVGVSRARASVEVVTPSAEALAQSRGGWAQRNLAHDLLRQRQDSWHSRMKEVRREMAGKLQEAAEYAKEKIAEVVTWAKERMGIRERPDLVAQFSERPRAVSPERWAEAQARLAKRLAERQQQRVEAKQRRIEELKRKQEERLKARTEEKLDAGRPLAPPRFVGKLFKEAMAERKALETTQGQRPLTEAERKKLERLQANTSPVRWSQRVRHLEGRVAELERSAKRGGPDGEKAAKSLETTREELQCALKGEEPAWKVRQREADKLRQKSPGLGPVKTRGGYTMEPGRDYGPYIPPPTIDGPERGMSMGL
ncbi:MobF family relaxase [Methylacidimicrobium tartarophylax]|uniref:Multifunctional conjugation protein TraI n=1 Tax=Methylacidimicrobium tartarophylax TaxID=1041768 RepID=A0A5E6MC39_9BACT|nr:MobF family relaxase [Methylacidimicrobium tartarophylax]VVM07104.1 Multifunctional conjugation protein TraI [Methylacidimicrobium tartarophylax]